MSESITIEALFAMAGEISKAKGLEARAPQSALADLHVEYEELVRALCEERHDRSDPDSVPSEIADCMFVLTNLCRKVGMTPKDLLAALRFKHSVHTGAESAVGNPAPPRRRVELTLKLSADSWDDATSALNQIATDIAIEVARGRTSFDTVSGGYSSGYILQGDEDAGITHDSWWEALQAYLDTTQEVPANEY